MESHFTVSKSTSISFPKTIKSPPKTSVLRVSSRTKAQLCSLDKLMTPSQAQFLLKYQLFFTEHDLQTESVTRKVSVTDKTQNKERQS